MRVAARTYLALAGAMLLALCFVTPAFADTNSGYVDWADVETLPGQGSSPHGGYASNTRKCSVCHAVHKGAPGGEALLRSTIADSCTYCHVSPSVSTIIVYEGIPANYSGTDFSNAHNSFDVAGVEAGITCAGCHQVHAADSAMTSNAFLTTKMLKGDKTYSPFPSPNWDPIAREPLAIDTDPTALTKWCAGCHFTMGSSGYYDDQHNGSTHILGDSGGDLTTYNNPAANYSGQVSWQAADYCMSCHKSQYNDGSGDWPHYTTGDRFLIAGAGSTLATAAATDTTVDGICLRCHRDGLGDGIGQSY